MAVREIVTLPDPVLRRKAHKINNFDADIKILIDDMVETMRVAPGVGLAAPQIGISQRIIVVEFGDENNDRVSPKLYRVLNPEIVKRSQQEVMGIEACLSVPGLMGDVARDESIVVKGMDVTGKPLKIKAKGWLARIFQHEIDHLDGVLYIDRAEKIWQPKEGEDILDTV